MNSKKMTWGFLMKKQRRGIVIGIVLVSSTLIIGCWNNTSESEILQEMEEYQILIQKTLRDVEEKLSILRNEFAYTDEVSNELVKKIKELVRFRVELYDYLDKINHAATDDWYHIRGEIDKKFYEFEKMQTEIAV